MKKKGMAYILAICMSMVSLVGYAEEGQFAEEMEQIPVGMEEVYDPELMRFEDELVNRFIVRYYEEPSAAAGLMRNETNAGGTIKRQIDAAFSQAIRETNLKREQFAKQETLQAETLGLQSSFSMPFTNGQVAISEWKNGYGIIELEQKVSPDVFMEEMEEVVAYIQPDYQLEFASEDTVPIEVELEEASTAKSDETTEEEVVPTTEPAGTEEPIPPEVTEQPVLTPNSTTEPEPTKTLEPMEEPASTTRVALIDGGVDIDHEALEGRIVDAWDFVEDKALTYNAVCSGQYYHGTHVAGIIAEAAPNAAIMPLKVFDQGRAYTSDIVDAIEYAQAHGAAIVNCSWGSTDNNPILKEAMGQADMLFVCAAGNNRVDLEETPIYPACFDLENSLSVTSANSDSGLSYFSNYGDVDIAARGREVISAWPENQYGEMSGTSMAAGYVSGAAALVEGNIFQVKQRILDTALHIDCLEAYVDEGRKISVENLNGNIISDEVLHVEPYEDFDDAAYHRTPAENWELFSSLKNVKIEAGSYHTMVLKENGTVWVWGRNTYGQLGDGTKIDKNLPIQVIGLTDVKEIAAGNLYSVAVTHNGEIYTWGRNYYGQLGIGSTTDQTTPQLITGIPPISYVAAGINHVMAVSESNQLYGWGQNIYGQLGIGNAINQTLPQQLTGLPEIAMVQVGGYHTIAMSKDEHVYVWGYNNYGQLGIGNITNQTSPQQLTGITGITEVAAGGNHTVIITQNGDVYACGMNTEGQLGVGYFVNQTTPQKLNNIPAMVTAAAGGSHTLTIAANGDLYAWGNNEYGQLGTGGGLRLLVANISEVSSVSAGYYHTVAMTKNGAVYTWGDNTYGQIGDGTTTPCYTPYLVGGIADPMGHTEVFVTTVGADTYYSELSDGGALYKNNTKLTDEPVTWICTNGTGVYFSMGHAVYTIVDAEPVVLIENIDAYYLVADHTQLYFSNWSDSGKLYVYTFSNGVLEKMSNDIGASLTIDATHLYYSNSLNGGILYKIDKSARGTVSGEAV